MKTFGDIAGEVLRFANRTDLDKETVVKEAINRRYKEILQFYNWPELLQETTVTATTETVGLPQSVAKIIKVYDRTNNRVVMPLPDQDLTERYIKDIGSAGNPQYYSRLGNRGVLTQPSAATALVAVTDAGSDSGTYRVRGYDANGLLVEDEKTIGTVTDRIFTSVLHFSKSVPTSGVISLKDNTEASTYARLAREEKVARYAVIRLHPIPTSVSLHITHSTRVSDLDDDEDDLLLDCEHILVIGAFSDLLRNLRQFAQAEAEELRYQTLLEGFLRDRLGSDSTWAFMPDMNKRTERV
ncbi:MAG: hypothetical protein CXT65_05140 [Methanobacteriota archaeon]|nr:MAG: hypothetical protein CXT65_05140 [Euryarchaeota archaeon]